MSRLEKQNYLIDEDNTYQKKLNYDISKRCRQCS